VRTLCGARVGVRAAQVDPLKDLLSLKLDRDVGIRIYCLA